MIGLAKMYQKWMEKGAQSVERGGTKRHSPNLDCLIVFEFGHKLTRRIVNANQTVGRIWLWHVERLSKVRVGMNARTSRMIR